MLDECKRTREINTWFCMTSTKDTPKYDNKTCWWKQLHLEKPLKYAQKVLTLMGWFFTQIHIKLYCQSVMETAVDATYGVAWTVHWAVKMERSDWTEEQMELFLQVIKEKSITTYINVKQTNTVKIITKDVGQLKPKQSTLIKFWEA